MKYALVIVMSVLVLACHCFECTPFGPDGVVFTCANLQQEPLSFGGSSEGQIYLYLFEDSVWQQYIFWTNGLPLVDTCKLNETTMMAAFNGDGSYSDGVYNFNLSTHVWSNNEWFMRPHFLIWCPGNSNFYVGEREGLFRSANGIDWYRITSIGSGDCNSFASHESHIVVNRGTFTYYSVDSGQSWQEGDTANLRGFRFTAEGILHAIMDVGSDSDGLWRSDDFGATWNAEYYTDHLACIGPDYSGSIVLGWSEANSQEDFVAMLSPENELTGLTHPNLSSAVREIETFPLINTPSFYVLNEVGCFYLTGFTTSSTDEDVLPPLQTWNLHVYPNPAGSELSLVFGNKTQSTLDISLFDMRGRLVASMTSISAHDGVLRYSLPKLSPGIYLLKVDGKQQTVVKRIVICD